MIIITKKLHPRRLAAGCLLGACAVILLGAAFGVVDTSRKHLFHFALDKFILIRTNSFSNSQFSFQIR